MTNPKVLYRYIEGTDRFDDARCLECRLLPICSGGCPHTVTMRRYEGKEADICPIYKDDLEDFLYMHYQEYKGKQEKDNV